MKRFDKVLYEMLKRDRALIFVFLYRHSMSFSKAIYYTCVYYAIALHIMRLKVQKVCICALHFSTLTREYILNCYTTMIFWKIWPGWKQSNRLQAFYEGSLKSSRVLQVEGRETCVTKCRFWVPHFGARESGLAQSKDGWEDGSNFPVRMLHSPV